MNETMPKSKFDLIYKDLKQKIEQQIFSLQDLLPSENTLVDTYSCSRNTIRRAIQELVKNGYVQSIHGKGVQIIYQPVDQTNFTIGGIESFKESAARNNLHTHTKVLTCRELTIDEKLARQTGFPPGSVVYFIQRIRYLEEKALIFDTNFFLKTAVPGLTREIAAKSIYDYIEQKLGMNIVTSKRQMTVERATAQDEACLQLGDYNCLAVITSQTFNSDGIMFEYTESRHRPDYFCFQDTATRKRS